MSSSRNPPALVNFKTMLRRLGFLGVSARKVDDALYVICAVDPMDDKRPFCRTYSLDDMRCITHASDIFWRYIK